MPRKKKFDPEGKGYDMESALFYGLRPDSTGHWPSRVPETGLILSGTLGKCFHKEVEMTIRCILRVILYPYKLLKYKSRYDFT